MRLAVTVLAIDLDRLHRTTKQVAVSAVEHDIAGPFLADHMILPLWAQYARFRHQKQVGPDRDQA